MITLKTNMHGIFKNHAFCWIKKNENAVNFFLYIHMNTRIVLIVFLWYFFFLPQCQNYILIFIKMSFKKKISPKISLYKLYSLLSLNALWLVLDS